MTDAMPKSLNILLLEDDLAFATALIAGFARQQHQCSHEFDCANLLARELEQEQFDLVLLDLKLAEQTSLGIIPELRQRLPQAKIIMITGFASIATTVEAIKNGADDYLPKPVNVADILKLMAAPQPNDHADQNDAPTMSPKRLEWEHIQRVLSENDGNISRTAKQLNMHRRTLQRKLQKKPQLQ